MLAFFSSIGVKGLAVMISGAERGPVPEPLKRFIWDIQSMVELAEGEREILMIGRDLMARLIASDDWLPKAFAASQAGAPRQFLIYGDGMQRFCVVSSVLSRDCAMSISKKGVWEIMALVTGSMQRDGRALRPAAVETSRSGDQETSTLANRLAEGVSIAVHVYGGDVARLSRSACAADGSGAPAPLAYANDATAPAYDIFSIQTEIRD